MGVKPELVRHTKNCGYSFWPGGLIPEYLSLDLFGWDYDIDYDSNYPDLPNRRFNLGRDICGIWIYNDADWYIQIDYTSPNFYVAMLDKTYSLRYSAVVAEDDPMVFTMTQQSGDDVYIVGGSVLYPYTSGYQYPEPWDAADLFVIPYQDGYFGEDLPADVIDRYVRFANEANRTNIHIIGDF